MGEEIHKQAKFDYIKANSYRVVHADGAWGGITPTGNIFMAIFSQRPAIPKQTVYEVMPEGRLGAELRDQRVSRDAIIREIEVGIQLDPSTAKVLLEWLREKIEILDKARSERNEASPGEPTTRDQVKSPLKGD
jgi:hypothetical protein